MARIVITEFMDERAVAQLRERHEVLYQPTLVDDAQALTQALSQCEALIVRNRTQVRGDVLAALKCCRVIGRLGVGLDNIDVIACQERGMQVIAATGANALSVAEYVITCTLMLLRGAYQSSASVADGQWPRNALSNGRETAGKRLGIIGFGSIGRCVARLAKALDMQVQAYDAMLPESDPAYAKAGVSYADLESLTKSADVITLHVPLVSGTRGLFDAARVGAMKRGAVLINTSRGNIVDVNAVVAALRSGHLGAAALDVFDTEPLPADASLRDCPGLLLSPHISGVSVESNERVSFLIADKVAKALA